MGKVTNYNGRTGVSAQKISVTEIISEGPIRGASRWCWLYLFR